MTRATENLLNNSFFDAGMNCARNGITLKETLAASLPGLAREYAANGWKHFHGQYAPAWPIDCKPSIAWAD